MDSYSTNSGIVINISELSTYAKRKGYRIRVFNGPVQGDGFLRLEGENFRFYPDHLPGDNFMLMHGQKIGIQHDGTIGEFAPRVINLSSKVPQEAETAGIEQTAQQAGVPAEVPGTVTTATVQEVGIIDLNYVDLGKVNGKMGEYKGVEGRFAYGKTTGLSFIPTALKDETLKRISPNDEFTVFDASDISFSYHGVACDKITCKCPENPEQLSDKGSLPDNTNNPDSLAPF